MYIYIYMDADVGELAGKHQHLMSLTYADVS